MAQVSEMTLRLEILRDTRDQYLAAQNMKHTSRSEEMLYALKIAECEAMIKELLGSGEEP